MRLSVIERRSALDMPVTVSFAWLRCNAASLLFLLPNVTRLRLLPLYLSFFKLMRN
jgi:hypothetical protein